MKTKPFSYGKHLTVVLLATLSCAATASDFDTRTASEKRSSAVGIGRDSIDLLQRGKGPGADTVATELLSRFDIGRANKTNAALYTSDRFKKNVDDKQTALIGDEGWMLQVFGDGSSVRYRNYRHLEKIPDIKRSVAERFSNEELEEKGQAFIEEELAGLVTTGPDEEIVPYFTQFEVTGGGRTQKGNAMDPEMVQTHTVVFTRSIGGLPVVGGGSKVAVIFANDGQVIGFDYDWPQYKAKGKRQNVLSLSQIKTRSQEYSKPGFEDKKVQELHFDCGYVDFGERKRDHDAPIQAGCMRQTAKKQDENSGEVMVASLDFLPAGEVVEPDAFWSKGKLGKAESPDELKQ